MEYQLKQSIIYAQLDALGERIDRVTADIENGRIGYRLARYRRRLLYRDCEAIEAQAAEWGVLY